MFNPSPDLRRSLTLFRLLVAVNRFLHAGGALGAMGSLEAGVQAVMTHLPVATAIAWLLVRTAGMLAAILYAVTW